MARITLPTGISDGKSIYFQVFSELEEHYKMAIQKLAIYEDIGEPEELCKKPVAEKGLFLVPILEEFDFVKNSVCFLNRKPIGKVALYKMSNNEKLVCDSEFSDINFSYCADGNYILAPKCLEKKERVCAIYSSYADGWQIIINASDNWR